ESRPFHCLFGSLMWMWVEDPTDPRGIPQYFGRRDPPDTSGTKQTPESWMDQLLGVVMPRDFGSPNHASRRRDALESHMATLPDETQELLWLYDYWLGPSWKLRQYLWAHEPEAEATARTLIRVLGAATVKQVLRFMATNYWERYLGWPDLLTWRDGDDGPEDVMLIEVKSRGDRLSEDQRTWIQLNATELGLPFRLAKVHRVERLTT
ncbi:MAG: VRR-NUC domain-containing protein, partial [Aeromicrobium sp.]